MLISNKDPISSVQSAHCTVHRLVDKNYFRQHCKKRTKDLHVEGENTYKYVD
jgi:hypothetical protein